MIDTEREAPPTLAACLDEIISQMSEEDKTKLAEISEHDKVMLHHGFGTQIRNSLNLWHNSDKLAENLGVRHPDNMSGLIIEALHLRLWEETHLLDRNE